MNVTKVPAHIIVEGAAVIVTLTGKLGLTVIVIPADVAGFPVAHVALEVKTHVTISPVTKDAFEYVVELIPTFTPFNFH